MIASLIAALANLVGSAVVPAASQPLRFHESATLGHLVVDEQPHIERRFGLYGGLRDLAAGGAIVVPKQRILDAYTLEHLSLLQVDRRDYATALTEEQMTALLTDARFSGKGEMAIAGREVRPYVVVSAVEAPTTLRVVLFEETVVIVEESLYLSVVGSVS